VKENIEDYIKNRDFSYAIKCGKCDNAVGFEPDDIDYRPHIETSFDAPKEITNWDGYVKCPWCGHAMFIGVVGRTYDGNVHFMRKYFTTIDNRDGRKVTLQDND